MAGDWTLHYRNELDRQGFEIVPIQRTDVYESVLTQLDKLVRSLRPGDRLPPERELAERLDVGRLSVREALRALESMGRVEIRRNSGSYVLHPLGDPLSGHLKALLPFDMSFLEHLVHVRAAVEDKVVELAVRTREDEDVEAIAVLLERMESEMDEREPGSLDLRFEALLARIGNNPILIEIQRSVHQLWVEGWAKCGIAPGDRRLLHTEHVGIYEAIRDGDVLGARVMINDHVNRSVQDSDHRAGR